LICYLDQAFRPRSLATAIFRISLCEIQRKKKRHLKKIADAFGVGIDDLMKE
jgi:CRISPR/Cas system endoribonuclease Cas6 (RAMP superfamily)